MTQTTIRTTEKIWPTVDSYKLLDHGEVRLLDYMGSDDDIVQAARVSYGSGTSQKHDTKGLLRYLVRHRHTSPIEMCELKFYVKMPIFVARQWIRHRMASVNEYSARYSIMKDEFYIPKAEHIKKQGSQNKQGSGGIVNSMDVANWQHTIGCSMNAEFTTYQQALQCEISRETARINLPLATYTEWVWKIDLHNLLHFLSLRQDSHAQYEIRVYADAIGKIVEALFPVTWQAFLDYKKNAITFSDHELDALAKLTEGLTLTKQQVLDQIPAAIFSAGERQEFLDKLGHILDITV